MTRLRIGHFMPIYRKWLFVESMYSAMRDMAWCGENGHAFIPFYGAGCDVTMARNNAIASAIAAGCDYLLMQDADCYVLPGQGKCGLEKLRLDLINNPGAAAAGFAFATRDERTNCEPAIPNTVTSGVVGTGYMLIDLDACKAWLTDKRNLGLPLFDVERSADGREIRCGEDIYFCKTLRAAGWDVLIDSTLATGHVDDRVLLVLPEQDRESMGHANG